MFFGIVTTERRRVLLTKPNGIDAFSIGLTDFGKIIALTSGVQKLWMKNGWK